jgi:hypothetical protein
LHRNKDPLKEKNMNKKNALVELTPEQTSPNLARPEDFVIVEDDLPFHGQCGSSQREYSKLLQHAESFSTEPEEHPDVNHAKKPLTP